MREETKARLQARIEAWAELQTRPRFKIDNWGLISARDEIVASNQSSGTFPAARCLLQCNGTARYEMRWDGEKWFPFLKSDAELFPNLP